jgi:hypothetical protein
MRLVSMFWLVLLLPSLALGADPKEVKVVNFPEPVEVQDVNVTNASLCPPSQQSELVGFTTSTHFGGIGIFVIMAACMAEFPGSHLCTSEEVILTTSIPDLTGQGPAWLRPTYQPTGETSVRDISGTTHSANRLSCSGWGNPTAGSSGLTVDGAGRFSAKSCSEPHPIACCALVP